MHLQASFDVKLALEKLHVKEIYPSESKRRKSNFNDSDLDKYDWNKNKSAIIKLILEGANENEIDEIKTLFGRQLAFNPYFEEAVQLSTIKNLIDSLIVTPNVNTSVLSNHEIKIVQLICQEKTSQEIADILFVQKKTIESARSKILHKINARNIVGLAMYAVKHKLIEFRL
jgi:DNA-binding CsgD family transcriptional regulator